LLIPNPSATKGKLRLLWVSCGDVDGLMSVSKPFHEALARMEVPHIWHVDAGGHTWPVWKNDPYLIAQLLFKNKKDCPNPDEDNALRHHYKRCDLSLFRHRQVLV